MPHHDLPLLSLTGTNPRVWGHVHGETYRQQIKELAEIRLERICNEDQGKPSRVLELAASHLPVLEKYDEKLYHEFLGISEASNVDKARLVVLNNYTDLRDIGAPYANELGGCSVIYSSQTNPPLLAQTWDIHGSAMPYPIMIKVDDALVFSAMGCLGMMGLNNNGVGIVINNLVSIDARVGLMWPALVRRVLREANAKNGAQIVKDAPLGSGHHYAIADERDFFSIETSGQRNKIICEKPEPIFIHTNHCLDDDMRKTHIIVKTSTTMQRFSRLEEIIAEETLDTPEKVRSALQEVSLPYNSLSPHQVATCGTVIMDINSRQVWAEGGIMERLPAPLTL